MGNVGLKFQVLVKTEVPSVQVADVDCDDQDEFDLLAPSKAS